MECTLVFSGGSTKIPLHVGAYRAIVEHGIQPTSVWGNSCGSIMAAMVARHTPLHELEQLALSINFGELAKHKWWEYLFNIFKRSGLVSGRKLIELFDDLLYGRTLNDFVMPLNIIGHSLDRRTFIVFNKDTHPNMPVSIALRISCAIPIFFTPYKYDKEWFVDGGVSKGFPVDLISVGENMIGHVIQAPNEFDEKDMNIKNLASLMVTQLMEQSSENSIRDVYPDVYSAKAHDYYTITDSGAKKLVVKTFYSKPEYQFSTTIEEKREMMELGYKNMSNALNGYIKRT